MSETSEAQDVPNPTIRQPLLREVEPGERIVRFAGLKFILPCAFPLHYIINDPAVLDFINMAWHNAVISRLAQAKADLLSKPGTTYADLEQLLSEAFDNFEYNSRPSPPPKLSEILTDEQKARIKFARPLFNQAMSGLVPERADYEMKLYEWTEQNAATLDELAKEQAGRSARLASLLDSAGL